MVIIFYYFSHSSFIQRSIRLNRNGNETMTSTNQFTQYDPLPSYMQNPSYITNNVNNVSDLTHAMRKSAFTANNPTAKSFGDHNNASVSN